jgi:hypothetical protein
MAVVTLERGAEAAENSRAAFLQPADAGFAGSPPPGVLLALDRAAKVAADLEAHRLSVRFETGAGNRVQAHVIDLDGNVVRQLPVGEALELLSGRGPLPAGQLGSASP